MTKAVSKACFKCGETQPLTEFYKHKDMADGRLNKCKSCTKKDATDYRDANLEKVRKYDRARGNRAKPGALKKWRHAGGNLRLRAHSKVARAVRNGDIIPKPCEVCGETEGIHAHHDDYTKALEVRWLCVKHHRQHHAGRKID